ncbi:cytochrome b N-terminal domain-containing protein [Actinomadura sp. WMMB 499]|uniref:cytochrome bc1 complex cytochrome b subunit n=1 Tax=Actinomadura sp. WMMB 499 TaxID=1219491 RepID=UPI0012454D0A|nr:cytochrome b N-terminal domain-containing protein [Actinomadura sp. WMMB 499]QFG22469.1 cytochrome bc complex cytochrome b subunit [Actinomadura sp. WMMB 499]
MKKAPVHGRGRGASPRPTAEKYFSTAVLLVRSTLRSSDGPGLTRRYRSRTDHWTFMFAQITGYSFAVLVLTGVFLTFYYDPSMARAPYDGPYGPLQGVPVSRAYDSTMELSFEVRGGLLVRQIHHWAALIFCASIALQLLRLFFTGGFRRPRFLNWLIWVGLFTLGMVASLTGTILPDDMLSGGSLLLTKGVLESIPVVGTHLQRFVFGGDFPGDVIIERVYWLHILVLPLAIGGALAHRRRLVRRQHGHTRFAPGSAARRLGSQHIPRLGSVFADAPRTASFAMFLYTCGLLVLLGGFVQINAIWQFGPFEPGAITAGAVPGWYMAFLDGAVRIMPGWELDVGGHPLTLAVLVPAIVVPGVFFTALALWPLGEAVVTGDRAEHHVLDRPRDRPVRTAAGAAGVTFYGLLWLAAANDQIAVHFHQDLFAVTWFFRVAVFAGPVAAFVLTNRICHHLVRRERHVAVHGRETGRIVMDVQGRFSEIHTPPPARTPRSTRRNTASPRPSRSDRCRPRPVPPPANRPPRPPRPASTGC